MPQPNPDLTLTLTEKERAFLVKVLSDYTFNIKGQALIPTSILLASILNKLNNKEE
jgi:hypothetical protein